MNSAQNRAIPAASAAGVRLRLNQDWPHPQGTVQAGTSGTVVRKFQGYQIMTDPCPHCGTQKRVDRIPAALLDLTAETPPPEQPAVTADSHHVDAETYARLNSEAVQQQRITLVEQHDTKDLRLPPGAAGRISGKYRGYQVDFDPCPTCGAAARIAGVPRHKVRFTPGQPNN